MDAEHKCLLLHIDLRRLPWGKPSHRVFELRYCKGFYWIKIQISLTNLVIKMGSQTSLLVWHLQSAHRTKSFTSRQMTTLFKLADKVAAFKDKLKLWEQRVNKGIFDMFQTLADTLKDSGREKAFSDLVSSHLCVLLQEFKRYFLSGKDPRTVKKWICNPFIFKPGELTLPTRQEDQLLDIANDGSLKCIFHTTDLPKFWMKVLPEYLALHKKP